MITAIYHDAYYGAVPMRLERTRAGYWRWLPATDVPVTSGFKPQRNPRRAIRLAEASATFSDVHAD